MQGAFYLTMTVVTHACTW